MPSAKKKRTTQKRPAKRTRSTKSEEPETVQTDEEWWAGLLARATPADRVLLKAARTALASQRQSNLDRHSRVWEKVVGKYEAQTEQARKDTTVEIIWDERALDEAAGPAECPDCGCDLTKGSKGSK